MDVVSATATNVESAESPTPLQNHMFPATTAVLPSFGVYFSSRPVAPPCEPKPQLISLVNVEQHATSLCRFLSRLISIRSGATQQAARAATS